MKIYSLALILLVLTLLPLAPGAAEPLLIPGKQALFQRVLAIPGASLHTQAGAGDTTGVTPFTAYYVYARSQAEGENWLQVGTGRHGGIEGWLRESDALEWNQGLTVAFREPLGRDRALLFRDADSLQSVVNGEQNADYDRLYRNAVAGRISSDSPVVAIQPPGKLDIRDDFYLVPIREHRDIYVGDYRGRMLRVASVPLKEGAPTPSSAATTPEVKQAGDDSAGLSAISPAPNTPAIPPYRAGLVFVIDATLSMDPYIERTREAVRKIHDSLRQADLLGNVNFGLVAFRDNPEVVPGLEYLTRTYVDLDQGSDPATFLRKVDTLKAARVSSRNFIEDAYAGMAKAIDDMPWDGHAARYLILITDAGPRRAGDPLAGTGLDNAQLRQMARDKGIAIFVMHLLTESTKADHASAATTYRDLSAFPGIGSLYYAVPTGDVSEFGQALDTLAGQITLQVQMAGATAAATASRVAETRPKQVQQPEPAAEPPANPQLAELQSKVEKLGYALRMRYLAETEGGKPPRLFNAWLLDRDLRQPEVPALDVQVLLTRDQLSDLHDILRQVLLTAEEGLLSPKNFLNELKSLAATLTRDPERLGETTATTAGEGNSLADLGFMREYIEDLPYTAEVMSLSLEEWELWPAREQIDFLNRLEEKIDYYRALHDHTDLWVSLDGGPVDGDSVFPVALEMLP